MPRPKTDCPKFEADMLSVLARAERPMTGAELHAVVSGYGVENADTWSAGSARVHIYRLRKKGHDIRNKPGVGYWLGGRS